MLSFSRSSVLTSLPPSQEDAEDTGRLRCTMPFLTGSFYDPRLPQATQGP